MKTVRRVGVGLAGVGVLLLALLASLPSLLSLESVRSRILSAVGSSLHRKVEAGAIHLELVSGFGARIEKFVVWNPPGWEMPALTTVDRLSVKLAFWPLLRKRVEVRRIELDGATVSLERDPSGRSSIADLLEMRTRADSRTLPSSPVSTHSRSGSGADPLPATFFISKVRISRGQFLLVDRHSAPGRTVSLAVEDIEGEIANVGPGLSPRFDVSARFLADAGRNVLVKGTFGPPAPGIGLAETPFHASFSAEDLALNRLGPYLPTLRRFDPGVLSIHGTLDGAPPGLLKVHGTVALLAARQSPAIPSFDAALALTLDRPNGSIRIDRSAFALAKLPLTAEGRIRGLPGAPSLDLRIATPAAVSIEDLLTRLPGFARSVPRGMKMSGRVRFEAEIRGAPTDLSTRASLDAAALSVTRDGEPILLAPEIRATLAARGKAPVAGQVTAGSGRLQRLPFEDFVADWTWKDGSLTLLPSLRAFGGGFRARFESDFSNPRTETRIRLEVERVQARPLAASFTAADNPRNVSGTLSARMSLASRGLAAEALAGTARGEGRVSLTNADLKTIELMPKVASALTTVGRSLGFQVPAGLESTRIQSIETALRLENGRVVTPGLLLSGRDVAVTADGWIGFDKTLAYEGRVVLGPGLVRSLGFAGRGIADEFGRVSVPFRVSGEVSSPNVDVEYSVLLSLGRRFIAQNAPAVVRGVADRILEHVRERAEGIRTSPLDFLQRIFARPLGAVSKK